MSDKNDESIPVNKSMWQKMPYKMLSLRAQRILIEQEIIYRKIISPINELLFELSGSNKKDWDVVKIHELLRLISDEVDLFIPKNGVENE